MCSRSPYKYREFGHLTIFVPVDGFAGEAASVLKIHGENSFSGTQETELKLAPSVRLEMGGSCFVEGIICC